MTTPPQSNGAAPEPQVLLELAAKIEAASGPDRELDAAIADAICWWPAGFARKDAHGSDRRWCDDYRVSGRIPDRIDCPAWSASLDAAMTLVPEGWDKGVQDMGEDGCFAEIWRHGWHDDTVLIAHARSCALALCAAALRARATLLEKKDG